jgi:hypothetical protein
LQHDTHKWRSFWFEEALSCYTPADDEQAAIRLQNEEVLMYKGNWVKARNNHHSVMSNSGQSVAYALITSDDFIGIFNSMTILNTDYMERTGARMSARGFGACR